MTDFTVNAANFTCAQASLAPKARGYLATVLRRLRYELFHRVLRFPTHHFDRTATGQVIAMVTAELEPVGGFFFPEL